MRVITEVTDYLWQNLTGRRPLTLSGFRPRTKPSAHVSWPRPPGAAISVNAEPVKELMVNKLTHNLTLSAEEGEALMHWSYGEQRVLKR